MAIATPAQIAPVAKSGWTDGELRLAVHLAQAGHPATSDLIAFYRGGPQPEGPAVRQLLLAAVTSLLQSAAAAFASAFGCGTAELLQFASPDSGTPQLLGANAALHRLDRTWGGSAQLILDACRPTTLVWPSLGRSRFLLLRGSVCSGDLELAVHQDQQIAPGETLDFAPGALLLLRRPPLNELLSAAAEAGLSMADLLPAAAGDVLLAHTTAGPLRLDTAARLAALHHRQVRLSDAESTALRHLLKNGSIITGRAELNAVLNFSGSRALDRLMLRLRNKLGDGVIRTVYGAGYAMELECERRRAAPATAPAPGQPSA